MLARMQSRAGAISSAPVRLHHPHSRGMYDLVRAITNTFKWLDGWANATAELRAIHFLLVIFFAVLLPGAIVWALIWRCMSQMFERILVSKSKRVSKKKKESQSSK